MKETKLTIEELKELKQAMSSYVHILSSLGDNVHLERSYEKQLEQLSNKLSLMIAQKLYMERA
jgi:two-component SAPR family response regulator